MPVALTKKIIFLSDFHLGAPDEDKSRIRELKIVDFLKSVSTDVSELFIVGDMFDFWFEYKHVVPKGFVRLFGMLAQLSDRGIKIHLFTGNHDMWMKDYFQKEIGASLYKKPELFVRFGKKLWIGHGDGLGPSDYGYKFLKKIFQNPVCQFAFGILPPYLAISFANYCSRKSREQAEQVAVNFLGAEKEWLIRYCYEFLKQESIDYFIFGHRHLPIDFQLTPTSRYINLGDWITNFSYATLDADNMQLLNYIPSLK
ncbi:MAG: UDP-2,3-diacylglucosamine diphosphatase [Phycisphaerales bacterium]|nr:UDP-2,3-diacylglucosamine diphosphatase [Phycisphaerales bacterium]